MKNIFKYAFLIISIFFLFNSCTEDFKPVFNENASQRFQTAKSKYEDILKSSKNGWLLQYFPSKDLQYGGFNYYLNFLKDNDVDVRSELYKSAKEGIQSKYAVVKQEGGAILSFEIFNPIMHFFATPSADEYKAKGGDFEFQIISYKDDVMLLQGLKTGNYMKLIKLKESPEEYNKKVVSISEFIRKGFLVGGLNNQEIEINNSGTPFVTEYKGVAPENKMGRNFTFTYNEGGEQKQQQIAFIETDKGIELYSPLTINGVEYREFALNKDKQSFISKDNKMVIEVILPPLNFIDDTWALKVDDKNASKDILDLFETLKALNAKKWDGEQLSDYILFGNTKQLNDMVGIMFTSIVDPPVGYPVVKNLEFRGVKGDSNQLNIIPAEGTGFNWSYYDHLEPMVDLFVHNTPYTLEKDNETNPTRVLVKSVSNPNFWFVLNKQPKTNNN